MNQGIYGLTSTSVTPVQGPFSGIADARKLLSVRAVVCGGGGGGSSGGSNRPGPGAGGGGAVDQTIGITLQTAYTVTIGAGAAVGNNVGGYSRFGPITVIGGGGATNSSANASGATGSGNVNAFRYGSLAASQGFAGGLGVSTLTASGGGGGAGGLGGDGVAGVACGNGGVGLASDITGEMYYYGGGGGSGAYTTATPNATAGVGGLTGGGNGGSLSPTASAGAVNSGGGGGGGNSTGLTGASGGSGVVVLRWDASQAVATLSSGLTATLTTVGTDTVLRITAGTGTVTFN